MDKDKQYREEEEQEIDLELNDLFGEEYADEDSGTDLFDFDGNNIFGDPVEVKKNLENMPVGEPLDEVPLMSDDKSKMLDLLAKQAEDQLETPEEPEDEEVDRFQYLIQTQLEHKKVDAGLEVRELIQQRTSSIVLDEDKEITDGDLSLETMEEELNEKEEYEMNFNNPVPNIPTESLTEHILIRGRYSSAFKSYISSDRLVPRGNFPLTIEVEDKLILFKRINPEPKTLFYLKSVLVGFKFYFVKDGEEKELDIFEFLGKVKIEV